MFFMRRFKDISFHFSIFVTVVLLLGSNGGNPGDGGFLEGYAIDWQDGSDAMQNLYHLVSDSIYLQSGATQIQLSYDKMASTVVSTSTSQILSRFNVDLTAVIQSYYQLLTDVSQRAVDASNNQSSPESPLVHLYDVTRYNPNVPAVAQSGNFSRQVIETDYYDEAQREQFFS